MSIIRHQYRIMGDAKPLAGLPLLLGFMATRNWTCRVDWCLEAFQMFNECDVVENFHRALYEMVMANRERFNMSEWGCEHGNYECGSTMCRGGFTIDLCGQAPYGYSQQVGNLEHVVHACYVKNCPDLNWLPKLTASTDKQDVIECMRCAAYNDLPDEGITYKVFPVKRDEYEGMEIAYREFCEFEYGDK